jgi:hypothetical protein
MVADTLGPGGPGPDICESRGWSFGSLRQFHNQIGEVEPPVGLMDGINEDEND